MTEPSSIIYPNKAADVAAQAVCFDYVRLIGANSSLRARLICIGF